VSRRPRLEEPGATYHVTARGNDDDAIFRDDHDRTHLLGLISGVTREHGWTCFAYCLMSNHYHLLVRTPQPNLSRGMQLVQTRYAHRFNARHRRRGHLFGDRFHDRRVEADAHLLAAAAYVVSNPVRAGIVVRPQDWPWSSYHVTAGGEDRSKLVDTDAVLELLSPDPTRARELYRELVATAGQSATSG
jgi:REP element-mobilizing transposase RayT